MLWLCTMSRCWIPALIPLFVFPLSALADRVVVGFGKDKPPFVFASDARGLEIDIFREALAERDHELSVAHFDNRALAEALFKDRVQAVATARTDNPAVCQVDEFIHFDNVAITLEERDIEIRNVQDLPAYHVVAWEAAYNDLGEAYFNLFAPQNRAPETGYLEHHSQEAQVKMFWLGRADVLVIDRVIFQWYRQQLPDSYQTGRPVTVHRIFDSPTHFPALFRDARLCEQFRQGLDELKRSGRYRALYDSYLE